MDVEFSELPVYFYGYDDIETFCLSQRTPLIRENVGLVLGVLRGGGIPALMLSQMLGIAVDFVYYDRRRATAEILNEQAFDLIRSCVEEGRKILLVEDIAGVGNTLINCYEYLLSVIENKDLIRVFALVHHESSRTKPDFCKDCSGVRAILPWERYVTGRSCLDDFLKTGEALIDDQRYKKTLAITNPAAPLGLRDEWRVDYRLTCDGDYDYDVTLAAVRTIGPEEIYCNDEGLIQPILERFPFVIVYKVIGQKRYRISLAD